MTSRSHPCASPEDHGPDAQPDPGLVAMDAACRPVDLVRVLLLIVLGIIVRRLMRRPKPDRPATWAECMAGAVGVFGLMTLAYAVIPHEWITFSDKYLQWDTTKFVVRSGQEVLLRQVPVRHQHEGDQRHRRRRHLHRVRRARTSSCSPCGRSAGRRSPRREEAKPRTSRFGRPLRRRGNEPATVGATAKAVTPDGPHRRQPAHARLRHRLRAAGGRPVATSPRR